MYHQSLVISLQPSDPCEWERGGKDTTSLLMYENYDPLEVDEKNAEVIMKDTACQMIKGWGVRKNSALFLVGPMLTVLNRQLVDQFYSAALTNS